MQPPQGGGPALLAACSRLWPGACCIIRCCQRRCLKPAKPHPTIHTDCSALPRSDAAVLKQLDFLPAWAQPRCVHLAGGRARVCFLRVDEVRPRARLAACLPAQQRALAEAAPTCPAPAAVRTGGNAGGARRLGPGHASPLRAP